MPSGLTSRFKTDSLGAKDTVSTLWRGRCVGLRGMESRLSLTREEPTIANFLGGETEIGLWRVEDESWCSRPADLIGIGRARLCPLNTSRKSSGHLPLPR